MFKKYSPELPLEISYNLFGLTGVQEQVVLLTPGYEICDDLPVLLLATQHTVKNVIGEFLQVTEGGVVSEVYSTNRNGESTVPWGPPVLQTNSSDTQSRSQTYCGLSVR